MKNKILSFALAAFFLFMFDFAYSQDYDLIITAKGDSIACRIDSINDTHVYYEMKSQGSWIHTHIKKLSVSEYKRNAIYKKQFNFKAGTSIIESPKSAIPVSIRDIGKNSVYVGILSINYARMIPGERVGVTFSGGLSFMTVLFEGGLGLMAETTLLTGGTKHFFEPGVLVLLVSGSWDVWPMVRMGYRYQGPEGFLFRAGPLFSYMDGFSILPAISIGYSF